MFLPLGKRKDTVVSSLWLHIDISFALVSSGVNEAFLLFILIGAYGVLMQLHLLV